ncbi:F-box domain-containing protein [Mycena kentingensis (nom. inval.)]|nr:F-box domain-containing protein [Mycena kentingensis (nom. inval.)]
MSREVAYRIEYTPASGTKCAGCDDGISQEVLRFGIHQKAENDQTTLSWLHSACVLWGEIGAAVDDIDGFADLRPADQQKIARAIRVKGTKTASQSSSQSASALRDLLASIDDERSAIHSQIASLQDKLAGLAKTRRAVAEELSAVTFPILEIPNEITTEIFVHYAELVSKQYQSLWSAPLVLTHVCRTWRELAIALPRLWAEIWLGDKSTPRIDFLLRLWFKRAGSTPLRVHTPYAGEPRSYNMLIGHSEQMETFSCTYPLPDDCSLDAISGRIGKLRWLGLTIDGELPGPLTVFADAPAFRTLGLSYFPDPDGPQPQLDFPWAQLTELRISGNMPDLVRMLAGMPNLELLELPGLRYSAPLVEGTLTPLPKLHTLIIQIDVGTYAGDTRLSLRFLSYIACPVLDAFELHVPLTKHHPSINLFLGRAPLLRALTLVELDTNDAQHILLRTPTVQEVTLRYMLDPLGLLRVLQHTAKLAPAMQVLKVERAIMPSDQPYEIMSGLLRYRCPPAIDPVWTESDERDASETKKPARLRSFQFTRMRRGSESTTDWPTRSRDISRTEFAKELREKIGLRGCTVDVCVLQTMYMDSAAGWKPGCIPLYSLSDVDDET